MALLAPLARLLRVDLNELLGFHETLSDEEAQRLSLEVLETAKQDGLDAGFALARERLREYPNSGLLAYTVAVLLQGLLAVAPEDAAREEREAQLDRWYEIAADCGDARLRNAVAAVLINRYIGRGDWDAAQRAIDAMPERPTIDRRVTQANLCQRRGEPAKAAKLLESVVLAAASELCTALLMLTEAELAAGEPEAAARAADAAERAVADLDLWRYTGPAAPLRCAVEAKDVRAAVQRIEQLLDALDEPWRPAESLLYRRIAGEKEGTLDQQIWASICFDLETNPDYDFLREDAAFRRILTKLQQRAARA